MKRDINLMLKPSSSKCNLKCKYCFYHSISDARDIKDYGFMELDTLKEIIEKVKKYCDGGNCTIGFQGGESTLIGLDFYKKLIEYTNEDNNGTIFNFSLQTNGTLIDDEWAKFFKENNFLVGVSLDGTKDIHNLNRIYCNGKDTFNSVLRGVNLLEKYNVDFNILTVITPSISKKFEGCYNFFKKNNLKYLQFIPCLEPLENEDHIFNKYSLSPKEYEEFLIKSFDLWYKDAKEGNYVSIRYFDNILSLFLGYDYEACDMRGVCSCQHIIESDGSVYPCDFYTYEKFSIGNILKEDFDTIHNKNCTINFMKDSLNISNKCKSCEFKSICRGGCRRYRENEPDNLNFFCSSYYNFFSCSLNGFKEISRLIRSGNIQL